MRGNWVWLFVMMSMMACAVSYKPLIPQRTHRLSMVKENEGEKAEAILVRSVGQVAKSSLFNFASAVVLSLSVATMRPTSAVAVTTLVADRVLQASDKSLIEGSMRDETGITTSSFVEDIQRNRPLCSDEFQIEFPGAPETLGLKLVEQGYSGFPITTVQKVLNPDMQSLHPELRVGAIVTSIGTGKNRESVDGKPLSFIAKKIKEAQQLGPVSVRFRDPSRFFELLDSSKVAPVKLITTSYLPANARDAGAAEQLVSVQRLGMPSEDKRDRAAQYLDVMELQFVAQVADTQLAGDGAKDATIVDSSAIRSPPGSSGQTIYYILGQKSGPAGVKFPNGWDITLRGMVVGEKRRVTLPYTLAYERKGSKDGSIPPFATVVYTVKLVSLT